MHNTPGWMTAPFVGLTLVGVLIWWLTAKPPKGHTSRR